MDLVIFEKNKPFIVQSFRDGEFDYMEAASEVFEADFFRFIKARALLDELAETYPNPRKKDDVPFWFYIASTTMRLHGVHAFHAFPMVVRSGECSRLLDPRRAARSFIPRRGIRRSTVKGLTTRISLIGRLLVIKITYER